MKIIVPEEAVCCCGLNDKCQGEGGTLALIHIIIPYLYPKYNIKVITQILNPRKVLDFVAPNDVCVT
jgi:hypothetical protein